MKAYFSSCFPDSAPNRRFLRETVDRVLEQAPAVVLLRSAVRVDEHEDALIGGAEVVDAGPLLDPRRNLAQQTEVVRGASRLVTTYGGFSYLGPLLDVPTSSFYSHRTFNPAHVEFAERTFEGLHYSLAPVEEFRP